MSIEQHAFIVREDVPTVTAWQAAITQCGFDLQINPTLQPFESSGFVPCQLGGDDSGFEISYESAAELLDTYAHLQEQVGPRDTAITFRFGADMAECACVLIASTALAKSFGALVYYPDDDLVYTVEDLISEAREALAELENPSQIEDSEHPLTTTPQGSKRWWEFWK